MDALLLELFRLCESAPVQDPRWLRLKGCALAALPPQLPGVPRAADTGAGASGRAPRPPVRPPVRLPAAGAEGSTAGSASPCGAWDAHAEAQAHVRPL